jgi:hypothetical protein
MTLEELLIELNTDPNTYGYATMSAQQAAAALNLRRDGITFIRTDVTPGEIRRAILVDDFIATQTILMGSFFESLMQSPASDIVLKKPDGTNANDLKNLKKMLKDSSASETAVIALATRKGSRAEELWGMGTTISYQDILGARGH